MATIVVEFDDSGIVGSSAASGFGAGAADAFALSETIEVALRPDGTSQDKGMHSDIQLTRNRDTASPKLAQACAATENIGEVTINVIEDGEVRLRYTLTDTYVSRYEVETADAAGGAYQPHLGSDKQPSPPPTAGVGALAPVDGVRPAPRPYLPIVRAAGGDDEVERVWLQPGTVTWRYRKGTNNQNENNWNIVAKDVIGGASGGV